jgi:hypothetical protein
MSNCVVRCRPSQPTGSSCSDGQTFEAHRASKRMATYLAAYPTRQEIGVAEAANARPRSRGTRREIRRELAQTRFSARTLN